MNSGGTVRSHRVAPGSSWWSCWRAVAPAAASGVRTVLRRLWRRSRGSNLTARGRSRRALALVGDLRRRTTDVSRPAGHCGNLDVRTAISRLREARAIGLVCARIVACRRWTVQVGPVSGLSNDEGPSITSRQSFLRTGRKLGIGRVRWHPERDRCGGGHGRGAQGGSARRAREPDGRSRARLHRRPVVCSGGSSSRGQRRVFRKRRWSSRSCRQQAGLGHRSRRAAGASSVETTRGQIASLERRSRKRSTAVVSWYSRRERSTGSWCCRLHSRLRRSRSRSASPPRRFAAGPTFAAPSVSLPRSSSRSTPHARISIPRSDWPDRSASNRCRWPPPCPGCVAFWSASPPSARASSIVSSFDRTS